MTFNADKSIKKSMGFFKYIKKLFTGRIGRLDLVLGFLLALAFWMIVGTILLPRDSSEYIRIIPAYILFILFLIFFVSLWARRWHDLGKSGYMFLTHLIPIVGIFFALYGLLQHGNDTFNKYGDIPGKKGHLKEIFGID